MAKLIIARHGLSEDNVKRVISVGDSKPGLVEEGISQAHKLGEMLSHDYINKFTFMVSSSMLRTNQTANIVNQHLQIEKTYYNINLREKEYGDLEGSGIEGKLILQTQGLYDSSPGGESDAVFISRVTSAICEYLKYPEELILIVAHGYVIEMVTKSLLDKPQYVKNAEFVTISPEDIIDFSGKWALLHNYFPFFGV
jgi:broad specificity phosphatase PhoE